MAKDPRKVFVIHGRDDKLRDSIFAFLRALGLSPIEWSQAIKATGNPAPFIGEVLEAAFSEAQAAVVLLNGDDMAYLRKSLQKNSDPEYERQATPQARPNVLFEAGMAFGRHPSQTILVQVGTIRPFSDIAGRHVVRLSNAAQQRHELANRLQVAGCKVDQSGQDWLRAGGFDPEEVESAHSPSLKRAQPKREDNAGLDSDAVRILISIAHRDRAGADQIGKELSLNKIRLIHFLDMLRSARLIDWDDNEYYVTSLGRKFLVNHGHF
jgi:hypothetical protein